MYRCVLTQIKDHCGNKQGVGLKKRGCSNVTFDGRPGADMTPRTSSSSFQFTDYDKQRVTTFSGFYQP